MYRAADGSADMKSKDLFEKPTKAVINLMKSESKASVEYIDRMMETYKHYLYFFPMKNKYMKLRNHLYFACNLSTDDFCKYLKEYLMNIL